MVYRKRIARADDSARPGDLVAIYAGEELWGYGLYNPRAEIGLRCLSRGPALPDESFWQGRIQQAIALRQQWLRLDDATDAYRLVHAEGDGFPGLVVDRLATVLSAEVYNLGMYQRAVALLQRMHPLCGTEHFVVRTSPQFASQEGYAPPLLASGALPPEVIVTEWGTRFRVRFDSAHKTGYFCDQRDNRLRVAQLAAGRSVLDLCCYTGGFAVQAKRLGPAREVVGVDLDAAPLQLARENAHLNQVRVRFVQADAFAFARDVLATQRRFDIVVLDPPKLIRNRADRESGKRKYFDLNRLAAQLVQPGGLLVSCSCSGQLSEDEFVRLVLAAVRSGIGQAAPPEGLSEVGHCRAAAQLLARTGAAADHPVSADCPESAYLKVVWLRL
jgi:23S rRNA (cytosine1962-C5)-methyltransferase